MRRSLLVSALLILLASAVCWGQRGGGGHMGGARMGGGFGARGGMHGGMQPSFVRGGGSGFHSHPPQRGPMNVQHRRFDGRGRGFRRYGTYPYYANPYYSWYGGPFWDWESSSYDSRDSNYQEYVSQTSSEINRLADEVQQLREERDYGQPVGAQPAPAPQPTVHSAVQEDLPVVVVFLDRHIQEVKNYAVANEMLVVLDGNRRTKFPLADIDLAATMKLNDERGVNFEIPNPVMNQ